eukprot:scaffold234184_cov37-Tisochrysis_lutea.AAC.3
MNNIHYILFIDARPVLAELLGRRGRSSLSPRTATQQGVKALIITTRLLLCRVGRVGVAILSLGIYRSLSLYRPFHCDLLL